LPHADQITSENIALITAYSSILASLIADSIIIKYAVVSAKIELKSVTTQRITFVFSQIAHELAKCILKKDIPPNCFINPGVAKVEDAADPRRQG